MLGWIRALRAPGRGAPAPGSSAAARIGCAGPGAATGWKSLTWPEGRSAAGLSPGAQDRGAEPPTLLVQAPGRPEPAYRGPVVVPVGLCPQLLGQGAELAGSAPVPRSRSRQLYPHQQCHRSWGPGQGAEGRRVWHWDSGSPCSPDNLPGHVGKRLTGVRWREILCTHRSLPETVAKHPGPGAPRLPSPHPMGPGALLLPSQCGL